MKDNNNAKAAAIVYTWIFLAILLYILGSFIAADLNIKNWGTGGRFAVVSTYLIVSSVISVAIANE